MKPYRTLVFLLSILATLLLLTFIISENSNPHFRYPSLEQVVSNLSRTTALPNNQEKPAINIYVADTSDLVINEHVDAPTCPSTVCNDRINLQAHPIEPPEVSTNSHVQINYGNNPHALDHFFNALMNNEHKTGQIRVLHFADSQVEGDMITSSIRQILQDKFGGSGVGFVPACTRIPHPSSVEQTSSAGWAFRSIINDNNTETKNFGILGGLSVLNDASGGESVLFVKNNPSHNNNRYTQLRLCLGNNINPYALLVDVDGKTADSVFIGANSNLNTLLLNAPIQCKSIGFDIFGEGKMLVYGVSMETPHGIFIDNIPVRGSSGTFFTKFDPNFANKFLTGVNTKLIIVQYGINVVPTNDINFKFYENAMTSQLKALKAIKSDMSIVLIGVSDMSQNSLNGYQSNPNVEKVLKAQKNAAMRAGVAFWDCYHAMGGENSMCAWAMAKPALAQKDFTHFNHRGARIVAKLFTNSLLNEYKDYIKQNRYSTNQ